MLDDERFAVARATARAERGAGNAAIAHDLAAQGVDEELIEAALASLPPEAERAERIAERRGPGARTLRYLLAQGFGEDAVTAFIAREAPEQYDSEASFDILPAKRVFPNR